VAPIPAQPHHPPPPPPGRLELATSKYGASQLILRSGLAAVRVTLGPPRFPLPYQLAGNIPELAPSPRIFRLEWERFAPAYQQQLDRLDWPAVEEQLRAIAADAGKPGAALLCFEDVTKGEQCHRRLAAEHWLERTGQHVPELGADARMPAPLRL